MTFWVKLSFLADINSAGKVTHFYLECRLNSKYLHFYGTNKTSKTKKYKVNLSTKMLFLQNDKNALTTFLHSTDDMSLLAIFKFDFEMTLNDLRKDFQLWNWEWPWNDIGWPWIWPWPWVVALTAILPSLPHPNLSPLLKLLSSSVYASIKNNWFSLINSLSLYKVCTTEICYGPYAPYPPSLVNMVNSGFVWWILK